MFLIAVAIVISPLFLPLPLVVHHLLTLPHCSRCDHRMPSVDRHVCPDGAEEWMST